jgi:PAS domain S-box-containing protein
VLLLIGGTLLLSYFKMRLPIGDGDSTMSLAFAVDFAAIPLVGADVAMVVAALGVLAQCTLRVAEQQPLYRTAFSVASIAIAVQCVGQVWTGLGGTVGSVLSFSGTIVPLSAAATSYFVINTGLVASAIALASGRSPWKLWLREFLFSAPSYYLSAAVGTMVAICISHGVYALMILTVAPLYLSYRVYRASVDRIEAERCHAGELSRMVGTAQEALARATKSESALVEEKERLALERTRLAITLKTITDAVVTVDARGQVVLMNESAETLSGVVAVVAIGKPVALLFTSLGIAPRDYETAVVQVLDAGSAARLRCESTQTPARVIEITGTPVRDGEERVAGATWVIRDVTDQARVELERSKTARLESLGVLAGGLAHDFNNILMGVVGTLSMAQSLVRPEDRPLAQRLRDAEAACVRARGVTTQLLTFALRPRAGDFVVHRAGARRHDYGRVVAARHAVRRLPAGFRRPGIGAAPPGHRERARAQRPRAAHGRRPDGGGSGAGDARFARVCHPHGGVRTIRDRSPHRRRTRPGAVRCRDSRSHRTRRHGRQGGRAAPARDPARLAGAGDERLRRQYRARRTLAAWF